MNHITLLMLLIISNEGLGLYSKKFNGFNYSDMEENQEAEQLLSGFITSIGIVGKKFFKQDIATINFGQDHESIKITVINREMIQDNKTINFVFFHTGNEPISKYREMTTTIFMESKLLLRQQSPDLTQIRNQIDSILEKKYSKIIECQSEQAFIF